MAVMQLGSAPARVAPRHRTTARTAILSLLALILGLTSEWVRPLQAATMRPTRPNPRLADTSPAARQSAVRSIPVEKLSAAARAKVGSVLSHVTVFRRMPIRVIDCDPHLYLFLVQHPDVVVNIWKVLKISNLDLREIGPATYRVAESAGTLATVEFLYRSHDTHVIYAEGSYDGPLFARPVKGRCLMVLKSGYIRETDGRYYITTRLDSFLNVEPGGAELLTKTFHPLAGKVADANFVQTVAFLGSLSRTAEVNCRGVQRLASRLSCVQPEIRLELAQLAAAIAGKASAQSQQKGYHPSQVASVTAAKPRR
jgi:hypothetical protein